MHKTEWHDTRREKGKDERVQPERGGRLTTRQRGKGDDKWTAGGWCLLPVILMMTVTLRYGKVPSTIIMEGGNYFLLLLLLMQVMQQVMQHNKNPIRTCKHGNKLVLSVVTCLY